MAIWIIDKSSPAGTESLGNSDNQMRELKDFLQTVFGIPDATTIAGELLKVTNTASAVNELTVANAAAGNAPVLSSTGNDTNIDLQFTAKGTGKVLGAVSVLDRDVTETEVVNTTSETTVYTFSVPANTLSTNRGLRLTMIGDFLANDGGNTTPICKVKYGSTTIATLSAVWSDSSNRSPIYLETTIHAKNSTSAQVSFSRIYGSELPDAGTDAGTDEDRINANECLFSAHNTIAEDSTGALNLVVTWKHDAAHASLSFKCFTVLLELLP